MNSNNNTYIMFINKEKNNNKFLNYNNENDLIENKKKYSIEFVLLNVLMTEY